MANGLIISDKTFPFSDYILAHKKIYETRNCHISYLEKAYREGKTIYLIRSGVGNMKAYATCKIGVPFEVTDYDKYNQLRPQHCVPLSNKFDWNGNTKVFYPLLEVTPLEEEIPIKSYSPIIGKL